MHTFFTKTRQKISLFLTLLLCLLSFAGCSGEAKSKDGAPYVSDEIKNRYATGELSGMFDVPYFESEHFEIGNQSKNVKLYDSYYFTELFGTTNYSAEDLKGFVNNNPHIMDAYKPFILDYIDKMCSYYPNADFRIFGYNLSTVTFETKHPDDYTFVGDASAYYEYETNNIVLQDGFDLTNNARNKIILRHEMGHMFTFLRMNKNGYTIVYDFTKPAGGKFTGTCFDETFNTIFTTDPFLSEYDDATRENMGYAVATNLVRVLLDACGYDIAANRTNSISSFYDCLDAYMPNDELDPYILASCLQILYDSCNTHNQDEYREEGAAVYSYVCRAYFKKYNLAGKSPDEKNTYKKALLDKLLLGVPYDVPICNETVEKEFSK